MLALGARPYGAEPTMGNVEFVKTEQGYVAYEKVYAPLSGMATKKFPLRSMTLGKCGAFSQATIWQKVLTILNRGAD